MSMQVNGTNSPLKVGADFSMYGAQNSAVQQTTMPNIFYNISKVTQNTQTEKYPENLPNKQAINPEGVGKKLDLSA